MDLPNHRMVQYYFFVQNSPLKIYLSRARLTAGSCESAISNEVLLVKSLRNHGSRHVQGTKCNDVLQKNQQLYAGSTHSPRNRDYHDGSYHIHQKKIFWRLLQKSYRLTDSLPPSRGQLHSIRSNMADEHLCPHYERFWNTNNIPLKIYHKQSTQTQRWGHVPTLVSVLTQRKN